MTALSPHPGAALAYVARDWHVFPLGEGSKLPKIAKARGGRGFHDATSDPGQIEAWWSRWPRANVGIRTGATSGLLVLDVDVRHRGDDSLERLTAKYGQLPRTLTAKTPSGGWHHYFAWPSVELRNSASLLDDGLDTRGEGGYVAAAPSVIPRVGVYSWLDESAPVAPTPAWLVRLLRKPDHPVTRAARTGQRHGDASAYGRRALESECDRLALAPEGTRNDQLNRSAYSLGQLVAGHVLPMGEVIDALLIAASRAGLGDTEARRTIASGIRSGLGRPRRVAS